MQVRPKDSTAHLVRGMKKVVMVVPVDADVYKAQYVTEEDWKHRLERRKRGAGRHFHIQHHNRNDHGKNPVAERLQTPLAHPVPPDTPLQTLVVEGVLPRCCSS